MDFENVPAEPVSPLRAWLADAESLARPNPHAVALATVDPDGRPSARMVLLKDVDEKGAVFYTNYQSRKGRALVAHPYAALVLHWDELARQVIIEGEVSRVSEAMSDAYFASRPRASQLAAWASDQSEVIPDRATLDAALAAVESRYGGADVPRPPFWGGFRVSLERVEFWQGLVARLHDRIEYRPDGASGWRTTRLAP